MTTPITTTPDVYRTKALATRRRRQPARKAARELAKAMQASGAFKSRRLAELAAKEGKCES